MDNYTHTQLNAALEQSVDVMGAVDMIKPPDCLKNARVEFNGVKRNEVSIKDYFDSVIVCRATSPADAKAILLKDE